MLVDTDGVVDQFAAGGVEQAGQLTVDQRDGQDGDGHQAEGQEGAAAAVAVEDRIPVVHEGEDGTGGDGVNKNQFQTFVQAAFRLGVFHDNDSFSQVWLPAKTACPQKKHRIAGAFPHAVFRCCHTSRDRLRRSGCMAASIQFPGPEGPPSLAVIKITPFPRECQGNIRYFVYNSMIVHQKETFLYILFGGPGRGRLRAFTAFFLPWGAGPAGRQSPPPRPPPPASGGPCRGPAPVPPGEIQCCPRSCPGPQSRS